MIETRRSAKSAASQLYNGGPHLSSQLARRAKAEEASRGEFLSSLGSTRGVRTRDDIAYHTPVATTGRERELVCHTPVVVRSLSPVSRVCVRRLALTEIVASIRRLGAARRGEVSKEAPPPTSSTPRKPHAAPRPSAADDRHGRHDAAAAAAAAAVIVAAIAAASHAAIHHPPPAPRHGGRPQAALLAQRVARSQVDAQPERAAVQLRQAMQPGTS